MKCAAVPEKPHNSFDDGSDQPLIAALLTQNEELLAPIQLPLAHVAGLDAKLAGLATTPDNTQQHAHAHATTVPPSTMQALEPCRLARMRPFAVMI